MNKWVLFLLVKLTVGWNGTKSFLFKIRLTMPDSEWALISRRSITEGVEFINNDSKLNLKLTRSGDHAQYTGRTTGSVEWRQQRGELGDQQVKQRSLSILAYWL